MEMRLSPPACLLASVEVRMLTSQSHGEGGLSFLMTSFQMKGSQALEKNTCLVRKHIYNHKASLVNGLRKEVRV